MSGTPQQRATRRAALALLLCGGASAAAWRLTPTRSMATLHGEFKLDDVIPRRFGDWRVDESMVGGVVNPQQEALLQQLYSQILSRIYVNSQEQRVMLSIAYGNDQRDGMQMHYPEICYPAQGFQLKSNRPVELELAGRHIPARRLETVLGNQRYEPVTYWTVIGETVVRGGVPKKLTEMSYGFRGLIPDGLLYRVSSIDRDSAAAFELQQAFAQDMLAALSPANVLRVAGHDAPTPPGGR